MPTAERKQDESSLSQTIRDVSKLEVRVDNLSDKVNAVNLKATVALTIQFLNLGVAVFIISKLFDIAAKITMP